MNLELNNKEKVLDEYTIKQLKESDYLYFYNKLNKEEIKNLKYINLNTKIVFHSTSYLDLKEILLELRRLDKNNKVIIPLNLIQKTEFNNFVFSNYIYVYNNVSIFYQLREISLRKYVYYEKLLYKFVESALNLSPFEKYIYAYNITKQFKKYKKESASEDPDLSRNLYYILDSDYMVCSGYSKIFIDLLNKLGIGSIDISLEPGSKKNQENMRGHSRVFVYLNDEKYNINGFYFSDPTWDNDLKYDYYNNLIFTNDEAKLQTKFYYSDITKEQSLFDINNIEQFYKIIKTSIRKDKNFNILKKLLENLKQLDFKYIEYIMEKYEKVLTSIETLDIKKISDINDLLFDIGTYILQRINKTVSGDTIMEAVEDIYRHSYGYNEESLQKTLEEVRQLNSDRHKCFFKESYIVSNNGTKEIICFPNKFNKQDQNKIVNL